jgi:integrase
MSVWKLTDAKCKSAKAAKKQYKMFDGEGLYLAVTPAGGKHWRVAYRLDGKAQTHCMGPLERIPLKEARTRLEQFRASLFKGTVIRTAGAAPLAKVKSFKEISEMYWDARTDVGANYIEQAKRTLNNHIYGQIGAMPINQIGEDEMMSALLVINDKGIPSQVKFSKIYSSQVFDFALTRKWVSMNPCKLINSDKSFSTKKTVSMAALSEQEVPEFMSKIDNLGLSLNAQACRFLALTAMRTIEMRSLKWIHINGDVAIIPAEHMKMNKEHMVPLSSQALKIIDNMKELEHGSEYVFPNYKNLDKPVVHNIVLRLIETLGYQGRMTGHGWRSIFSTWANDRQYNSDVIETALAHTIGNETSRAYNRAKYLPQRKQLLDDWANWLMPQGAQESLRLVK